MSPANAARQKYIKAPGATDSKIHISSGSDDVAFETKSTKNLTITEIKATINSDLRNPNFNLIFLCSNNTFPADSIKSAAKLAAITESSPI